MFLRLSLLQFGLVLADMLIGFGIGIWFALRFRGKK